MKYCINKAACQVVGPFMEIVRAEGSAQRVEQSVRNGLRGSAPALTVRLRQGCSTGQLVCPTHSAQHPTHCNLWELFPQQDWLSAHSGNCLESMSDPQVQGSVCPLLPLEVAVPQPVLLMGDSHNPSMGWAVNKDGSQDSGMPSFCFLVYYRGYVKGHRRVAMWRDTGAWNGEGHGGTIHRLGL